MKNNVKSVQLDLKFQHITNFNDVKLVYQYIDSYSGRGKSPETASTFLAKAFATWDATLTPDIVDSYVYGRTIELMFLARNIKSKEDLLLALDKAEKKEVDDLPLCGRRGVRFYLNREDEKNLYEILKKHTEKNRAFLIYIFTKNYIMREEPYSYYEAAGNRLFQQIANLYYTDNKWAMKYIQTVLAPYATFGNKLSSETDKNTSREKRVEKELKTLFGK